MTSLRPRLRGFAGLNREARLLLIAVTVFGFGYGGIGLMLRPLYVLRLNLGTEYYGLYSSLGNAAFMAGSFGAGWLGTRLGTRRTMIMGAIGCLVGTAIMPLTESFDASYWTLVPVLSNLAVSAAWALVSVNSVAALTGVTHEDERDSAIGISNTLQGIGILLGNLLAGVLPRLCAGLLGTSVHGNEGFRLSLSVVLIFGLIVVAILWALPAPRKQRQTSLAQGERLPLTPLAVVGVFAFLLPASAASISTYASPYLDQELRLSTEAIGAISSASQALAVLGCMVTPWLVRRLTGRRAVILVCALMGLMLIPMAAIPHWGAAAFSRTMTGAVNMMRIAVMQMFAMAQVSQAQRPLMSGILSACNGVCFTVVSYVGGVLAARAGYRQMFSIMSLVTLLAVALFAAVTAPLIRRGKLQRG